MNYLTRAKTLAAALAVLTATNRHAYRRLAQEMADAGLVAVVEEFYSNDAADEQVVTYTLRVFPAPTGIPGESNEYGQYLAAFERDHDLEPDTRVAPMATGDHLNPPLYIQGPMGSCTSYEVFRPGLQGGSIFGTMPTHEIDLYDAT